VGVVYLIEGDLLIPKTLNLYVILGNVAKVTLSNIKTDHSINFLV